MMKLYIQKTQGPLVNDRMFKEVAGSKINLQISKKSCLFKKRLIFFWSEINHCPKHKILGKKMNFIKKKGGVQGILVENYKIFL